MEMSKTLVTDDVIATLIAARDKLQPEALSLQEMSVSEWHSLRCHIATCMQVLTWLVVDLDSYRPVATPTARCASVLRRSPPDLRSV